MQIPLPTWWFNVKGTNDWLSGGIITYGREERQCLNVKQ